MIREQTSFSWLNTNLFSLVTRLGNGAQFVFRMGQLVPQISNNFSFFPHTVRILAMTFPVNFFKEKKRKKEIVKYINWIFQFTETSTPPAQGVVNSSREEETSSIQKAFCHPDQTMQRHIFDDEVTLCSENGKKPKKQRISECFTLYKGSRVSTTELFSSLTKVSCFFYRKTRSMLWSHLKTNTS